MSGKREKEKRKQTEAEVQQAIIAKAERGKLDIVMLNSIKSTLQRARGNANGVNILIDATDNPSIARSEYLKGFAERYHDMMVDLCEKMGYGGVYVADPQFGRPLPGEVPKGAFQVYRPPQKLIVFGDEEN